MIMITMDDGRGLRAIDAVWEAVWSGNQTLTESPRVKGFSNSHGDDSSTRKT